jgi:hypothetical protein
VKSCHGAEKIADMLTKEAEIARKNYENSSTRFWGSSGQQSGQTAENDPSAQET